jgi:hypothetical protein
MSSPIGSDATSPGGERHPTRAAPGRSLPPGFMPILLGRVWKKNAMRNYIVLITQQCQARPREARTVGADE